MYGDAMNTYLPTDITDPSQWDSALYAFLAEKQRRSGSMRTVTPYSRMLQQFFGQTGCTPDRVTGKHVFAFAHGIGLSGREPGPITITARISAISSFYRFLIRMQLVSSNPCDALERPRIPQSTPRGLSADEVRRLLAVIPDDEQGNRERAVILTYLLTARRKSEVLAMVAGDVSFSDGRPYYRYRGKGGKTGRRELPLPALAAIRLWLDNIGRPLETLAAHESLWLGLSASTFYARLRKYLKEAGINASGIHVLRHTAAKLRRDAGESIEAVSQFLDHSSLAVTTVYLKRLEGQEDAGWAKVAEAIGI